MSSFTVGPDKKPSIQTETRYSDWQGEWCGLHWRPTLGQEPSWWGRLASRFMLGVRWHRVTKP